MFSVGSINWLGSLSHNGYENNVSTITENVPSGKLPLARSRQVTVENWKGPKHRRDDQEGRE